MNNVHFVRSCHLTLPHHEADQKHMVLLYRPECLGGYRWTLNRHMVVDICTKLVGSEKTFTNSDATLEHMIKYILNSTFQKTRVSKLHAIGNG